MEKVISCLGFEMKCELVTDKDEIQEIYQSWLSSVSDSDFESFWQHPQFLIAQEKFYENTSVLIKITEKGITHAILPCLFSKKKRLFRFSIKKIPLFKERQLRVLGPDFLFTSSADKESVVACFKTFLTSIFRRFDRLVFEDINCSGCLCRCLTGFKFIKEKKKESVYLIELSEGLEKYLTKFSRKKKYNLKREKKKLESLSGNGLRFRKVSSPCQIDSFLKDIDCIYKKSWQGKGFSGYRNNKNSIEYFEFLAEKGLLRSYVLWNEFGPLSFVIGYQSGGTYYFEETGYCTEWKKYCPGSVLTFEVIKELFEENSPNCLNFGVGYNQYKEVFSNSQRDSVSGSLVKILSHHGLFTVFQFLVDKLYYFLRCFVYSLRIDKTIKKLVKG